MHLKSYIFFEPLSHPELCRDIETEMMVFGRFPSRIYALYGIYVQLKKLSTQGIFKNCCCNKRLKRQKPKMPYYEIVNQNSVALWSL